VDPSLESLHGPIHLQSNGTLTIPAALRRELGLDDDQGQVHMCLNPSLPGTLILLPSRLVSRAMPEILKAIEDLSS
jgi:hypothetical protein